MSDCDTTATYDTQAMAFKVSKKVQRDWHFYTNVRYCEACDAYHVVYDNSRMKVSKLSLEILKMYGQGFQVPEIARYLEIKQTTVEWSARRLRKIFNAMNTNHLISIAIAVGALSPQDFVPPITEGDKNGNRTDCIANRD